MSKPLAAIRLVLSKASKFATRELDCRLLEIIQGILERINADLPEPKPVAELELAGLPGIYRPAADLEAAESGKQQVAVDTQQGQQIKRQQRRDEPDLRRLATRKPTQEGITIIVQGDFKGDIFKGEKRMNHDQRINIGGNVINSQVGQTLTNCTNMVQQHVPGERKDLLEDLVKQVQQLIAALPADKQDEAPQIAENLEMLVKQATSPTPNRKWYSVSKDGLLEASQFVKDFGVSPAGTLGSLEKLLWPVGTT